MILIFGSAYQGKRAYAMETYALGEYDFSVCREDFPELDLSKKAIDRLHFYILACIREGVDPAMRLREALPFLSDKVILCDEIGCGIVPLDPLDRAWREANGRCLQLLSKSADRVVRVFCGIGTVLKDG